MQSLLQKCLGASKSKTEKLINELISLEQYGIVDSLESLLFVTGRAASIAVGIGRSIAKDDLALHCRLQWLHAQKMAHRIALVRRHHLFGQLVRLAQA